MKGRSAVAAVVAVLAWLALPQPAQGEPERAPAVAEETDEAFAPPERPVDDRPPLGFRAWLRGLERDERRQVRRHLRSLDASARRDLFRRWQDMTPEELTDLEAELTRRGDRQREERIERRIRRREALRERIEAMSPDERRAFRRQLRSWQRMEPAERAALRRRLERFGQLELEAQEALVRDRFPGRNPEEQRRILERLRAAAELVSPPAAIP